MLKGCPIVRRKPLMRKGFRRKLKSGTRVTKSGRLILPYDKYVLLCHEVWLRDSGECQIRHKGCWRKLSYFSTAWADHIIKRSQGGSDVLENLRLACPPCHDWADNQGGKHVEYPAEAPHGTSMHAEQEKVL